MATTERRTGAATERTTAETALQGAWWKYGMGLVMCWVIYGAFFVAGGAVGFGKTGDIARIVFFHVPGAVLSSVCYFVGVYFAALYLFKKYTPQRAAEIDARSAIAMELGFLFCILATITGSIFAGIQWGSSWNWDPRETSIVIMLLLYASYLVFSMAPWQESPNSARNSAAVYALVALVPAKYLIWVVPRTRARQCIRPMSCSIQERLSSTYQARALFVVSGVYAALTAGCFNCGSALYKVRARRGEGNRDDTRVRNGGDVWSPGLGIFAYLLMIDRSLRRLEHDDREEDDL